MTSVILWVLVMLSLSLMIYGYHSLPKRFERHELRGIVFLKRTRLMDCLLVIVVLGSALMYEIQTGKNLANQSALVVLIALFYFQGMRYSRWLIYRDGFLVFGKFYGFEQLEAMMLAENGVLQINLNDGKRLQLPVLHMGELEKALWLLSDGQAGKLPTLDT